MSHYCRKCGKGLKRQYDGKLECYNCGKVYKFNSNTGWLEEVKKSEWAKIKSDAGNTFMTVKGQKYYLADGARNYNDAVKKSKKWTGKKYSFRIKKGTTYNGIFVRPKRLIK